MVNNKGDMIKRALNSGLIFGICSIIISIIGYSFPDIQSGLSILSYTSLTLCCVFAMKWYRDKDQNGYLTFKQGLAVGMLAVVGFAILSGAFSFIYIKMNPEVVDDMIDLMVVEWEKAGLSDSQIEMSLSITEKMLTPFGILISSVVTFSIIGLIINLITAVILKKDKPVFEELDQN